MMVTFRGGAWRNCSLVLLCCVLLGPCVVAADSTGWRNPSADSGTFTQAYKAYALDGNSAAFRRGGQHCFGGYAFQLQISDQIIGIEVRLDAARVGTQATSLVVDLSWDGGVSWTSTRYETPNLSTTPTTFILGSASDGWGRHWLPAELSSGNFLVRVTVVGGHPQNAGTLEWIPVTVFYERLSQEVALNPTSVTFTPVHLSDFDTGYKEVGQALYVTSNASWVVTVRSTSPTWVYAGTRTDPLKPAGNLEWRAASVAPQVTAVSTLLTGLTTSDKQVASGVSGTGIAVQMTLRMLLSYDADVPGSYSLAFVYTITAP